MAQAARLNLRMQKELKLLLTDPPPGASFPSLSAAASLSSIEAQIEGPEGTVYADGFFKLKIQIPDRYPFQPPNVTFATPIYHPNIDTGGRICLDILNLPPKGAWQPSLNVSTVLTSIGLLLSEPNPDDGLMHEASQEYKYNRQVFDQKARSMTEKYARIGACEIATAAGQGCQAQSLDCAEAKGSDTSMEEMHQNLGGNKMFCGISRKLSLESSELDRERIAGKSVNEGPSEHSGHKLEYTRLKQEPCRMTIGQIQSHQDLQKVSKKLLLEPSTSFHVNKDNDDIAYLVSVKGKSALRTDCLDSLPLVLAGSDFQQNFNHDDARSKHKTVSINSEHSGRELECKELKQESCRATIGEIRSHQDLQEMNKKLLSEPSTSLHMNKDDDTTDLVSVKGKSTLRTGCLESLPSINADSDFEQNYNQCYETSKPKTASIKSEKEKLLQPLDSKIGTADDQEILLSVAKKSSTQHHSSGTSRNLPPSHTDSHHKSEPHSAVVNGDGNGLPRTKHKKLGLAGRHFSTGAFLSRQCQGKAKAENQLPTSTAPHVHSSKIPTHSSSSLVVPEAGHFQFQDKKTADHSSTCSDHRQPLNPLSKLSNMHAANKKSEMESKVSAAQHVSCVDKRQQAKKQKTMAASVDTGELIVLDSEDSDEDQRATARSKLSLARRRFQGKLKS